MWSTETVWFDLALVFGIFAAGNVLFGHFEEHKPKPLRLLKMALISAVVAGLSTQGLRWASFTLLGLLALAAGYVHMVWLPRHGVNGWTGKPRSRYYELIGVRPRQPDGEED